ncbi:hypothetical protein SFUMM280S_03002 [Streptomyces fumanus]
MVLTDPERRMSVRRTRRTRRGVVPGLALAAIGVAAASGCARCRCPPSADAHRGRRARRRRGASARGRSSRTRCRPARPVHGGQAADAARHRAARPRSPSLGDVAGLGWQALVMAVGVVLVTFFGTQWLGRGIGLSNDLSLLVATGYSICGASAIGAVSGVLGKDKGDRAARGGGRLVGRPCDALRHARHSRCSRRCSRPRSDWTRRSWALGRRGRARCRAGRRHRREDRRAAGADRRGPGQADPGRDAWRRWSRE